MKDPITLQQFFTLLKAKQKPYEDALISTMQDKVNWIRKTSTYDLNQRQRESLERDKNLITCAETYIAIQQQIISHLFEKLEQAQTETAFCYADKLAAEQSLRDYIQKNHEGKVQSAA